MLYYRTVHKSQIQGAENGPEPQFTKSNRIMLEAHNTEPHSARCLATTFSCNCTKRRKQQQQQRTLVNYHLETPHPQHNC